MVSCPNERAPPSRLSRATLFVQLNVVSDKRGHVVAHDFLGERPDCFQVPPAQTYGQNKMRKSCKITEVIIYNGDPLLEGWIIKQKGGEKAPAFVE